MGQEALSKEINTQPTAEKNTLSKVEDLAPIVSIETSVSDSTTTKEDPKLLKEKALRLKGEIDEMEEKLQAKINTDRDYDTSIPTTVYLGDTEITPELLIEKKEELSKLEKTIPPKPKVKRTFLGMLFSRLP